ncbi:MAG: D-2-hydroxyacid dehydrogenase [Clostridiales bacterium]|nr:D-2-hydroxyacid dehydrogenase [Clostridiales bacterium]
MEKIIVLDGAVENPGDLSWEPLAALGELTVYDYTAPEDTIARIGDASIILTNKTVISAEVMAACPGLRYIGVLATGYNVIDIAQARQRGIVVANVPAYSTPTVAQFTMALLLEICLHVGHHSRVVHEGKWSACRDFSFWDYPLIELQGKTIGIVGYGSIGKAVAKVAKAFGMNVLAYSRHGAEEDAVASLDELYARADIVSLHCPLTAENTGMINAEAISKMKDGVIILNTARGGLINELDLRHALLSGKVYAAASDVTAREPINADSPLLGLDNMIITPHIAWAATEARQRLMDIATDNVRKYLAGTPQNNVAK